MEEYIQMNRKDLIEDELINTKLIDMALEVVKALPSNLDLNVDPILNVDDQPPLIVKLTNARHHASTLFHLLLNNLVNFQDVTDFQKVLGKLDKVGVANLNKQQQRTLDSYFKSS